MAIPHWVDLNREIDFCAEAVRLPRWRGRIIDSHVQLSGPDAVRVYRTSAELFGVRACFSLTQLEEIPTVREALDGRVHFVACHRLPATTEGVTKELQNRLPQFHAEGSRIVKIYGGVHLWKQSPVAYAASRLRLDSDERRSLMDRAAELGMGFLVHAADPDCYFTSLYPDPDRFGAKREHLDALERILMRYKVPVIGSHMGGNPEDLAALDDLLSRYPHYYINTSATKWVVRALSRHGTGRTTEFFEKWSGRVLFGSDVVTFAQHLTTDKSGAVAGKPDQASSPEEAFRLYASRLMLQRRFWETGVDEVSPIADPDLRKEDPTLAEDDAPRLAGLRLSDAALQQLYWGAAAKLLRRLGGDL